MGATKKAYTEQDLSYLEDTFYVLNGKWKFLIISAMCNGCCRFVELGRAIPKITTRMLSKELKELEANKLVERIVHDDYPVRIEYHPTAYCLSMQPIIDEMIKWGRQHRKKIMSVLSKKD